MSRLPPGWRLCSIGEVASVKGGGTPPSKDASNFAAEGGIPWITPADLSGYRQMYISRGRRNLTEKGFDACSAVMLPKGSVLFSSRAPVGYVAIATNELATNQGFKSFIFPSEFDPRYVYYYLKHIRPIAESMATGTTFKELSGANAAKLPFLVAPPEEQKRIADKLDRLLAAVDTGKARLDAIPDILKRFRQSVLAAAVSGELTEEWRRGASLNTDTWRKNTLRDLVVGINQGWSPKCEERPAADENEWAVIKTSAILPLEFLETENKALPNSLVPRPELQLHEGDLLITRAGPRARAAVCCHVSQVRARLMICDKVYRFRAREDRIIPQFLAYFLNAPATVSLLDRMKTGISDSGVNLTQRKFLDIVISTPSLVEQYEIVRLVASHLAIATKLERLIESVRRRLDRLSEALLTRAFRGELTQQDTSTRLALPKVELVASSASRLRTSEQRSETAGKRAQAPAAKRATTSVE